ncbi:MAG: dethiobiotin synthase [Marinifilaceae bacterium]
MKKVYFISGIDTDAGKSIATGIMARTLLKNGVRVITQKFIQTGCQGIAEDILTHRTLMGIEPTPEDEAGITCPYVMSYPASPHLAAEIDNVTINLARIDDATAHLVNVYDVVLLEGAGGLCVPVNRQYNTIDYITDKGYPLILVTSSKLGSINHTLMSLELCKTRGIEVSHVIYNHFPNNSDIITKDTITVIQDYLKENFPETKLLELPVIEENDVAELNILA